MPPSGPSTASGALSQPPSTRSQSLTTANRDDRQFLRSRPPAWRERKKGATVRSRLGCSGAQRRRYPPRRPAYDSDAIRVFVRARGAWANFPLGATRKQSFPFCKWGCRWRNLVERFFSKLKHFRTVAARYDKRGGNFLASVQIASIRIWLRTYEPLT